MAAQQPSSIRHQPMTTLFFLFSLLFTWQAWNLYHPNFDHPRWSFLSFAFGLPAGELAPHVIFWQAVIIAFFVLTGSVQGLFGAIGFLLCTGAWAMMAVYYYEGSGARDEVADALVEGLGEDYESEINEAFRLRFSSEPNRQLIRHPLTGRDPDVEYIRDLHYGDHGQRLDIRRPRNRVTEDPMPVLMHIHGGGWTYGRKDDGQAVQLMNYMARRDWVSVSISYRLSPAATFPDHIIDCKQALVWIKDHIADYGGNPGFIMVTGGSAGGHLASLLALSAGHQAFQPGFEDRDTTVQGAVPFYGVFDFTDEHRLHQHDGMIRFLEDKILKLDLPGNEDAFHEASPIRHISNKAPPMMVVHGELDTLVPVEASHEFAQALREVSGNKVVMLEVSQAQHAFDVFPSIRTEYVKFGVERFLTWTYSQYLKSL